MCTVCGMEFCGGHTRACAACWGYGRFRQPGIPPARESAA
jgi:hypothetical protein